MATLTYDNRASSSLTPDNRSNAGSLSVDNKTGLVNLWSSSVQPWLLDTIWLWSSDGGFMTKDIRN